MVGCALGWAARPSRSDTPPLPVPTFAASAAETAGATRAPRATLLPTDCTALLTAPVDVSALLGQPVGVMSAQTVVGVPAPSVGLLERLTCNYRRGTAPEPILVLGAVAFSDPGAAARQRDRNIAVERGDTRAARDVPLGKARATLLTQSGRYLLMVAHDRCTVTVTLARGVVRDQDVEAVLTDLVRRAWPDVAPASAQSSAPTPVPNRR